jgi:hypothetical protein
MIEPGQRHGNGDRNDNDVAKSDREGQKDRDRKIKEGEKKIDEESERRTGQG